MKLTIKVQAGARQENVETLSDGTLKVKVRAPAVDGRANARVLELLSVHFKCSISALQILRGQKSTRKLIEIQSVTEST